jgi:predicted transcriptional regulator
MNKIDYSENQCKLQYNKTENRTDIILKIMADKYSQEILRQTSRVAKPAHIIAAHADIPLSTVYRRLQDLIDVKLMNTSGIITEEGKKVFLYKNTIDQINTFFDGAETRVEIVYQK